MPMHVSCLKSPHRRLSTEHGCIPWIHKPMPRAMNAVSVSIERCLDARGLAPLPDAPSGRSGSVPVAIW